jgi:hypothetical protein
VGSEVGEWPVVVGDQDDPNRHLDPAWSMNQKAKFQLEGRSIPKFSRKSPAKLSEEL